MIGIATFNPTINHHNQTRFDENSLAPKNATNIAISL